MARKGLFLGGVLLLIASFSLILNFGPSTSNREVIQNSDSIQKNKSEQVGNTNKRIENPESSSEIVKQTIETLNTKKNKTQRQSKTTPTNETLFVTPPMFGSGKSISKYFNDDSKDTKWPFTKEHQFYEIIGDTEFKENFPTISMIDLYCKDTVCRITFDKKPLPQSLIDLFANNSNDVNANMFSSVEYKDDGVTHLYIFRNL